MKNITTTWNYLGWKVFTTNESEETQFDWNSTLITAINQIKSIGNYTDENTVFDAIKINPSLHESIISKMYFYRTIKKTMFLSNYHIMLDENIAPNEIKLYMGDTLDIMGTITILNLK